jgi:hypothetical protein
LGTESKAIEGTACCAKADGAINNDSPISQCFMLFSPKAFLLLCGVFGMNADPASIIAPRILCHDRSSSGAWHIGMRIAV